MIDAKLGRYRVTAQLGWGHTHDVYRADEDGTGFSFAIKMPRVRWRQEEVLAAARDFAILRKLDDPHIVRLREINADPSYAVFELVEGEPLAGLAPMPWQRALAIVMQMCAPLHLAASRGLVYRKLSLENVFVQRGAPQMLTGDPYRGAALSADVVKIMLGTNVGTSTPPMDTGFQGYIGPIDCMSPELLEGRAGDERSYVFTLGVFLYRLISGEWPFGEQSLVARFLPQPAIQPLFSLLSGTPRAIDEVIAPCLRAPPATRPQTLAALREQLAAIG